MSRRIITFVIILAVFSAVLFGVSLTSKQKEPKKGLPSQKTEQKEVKELAQTKLSLSPNPLILSARKTDEVPTLDVKIKTKDNRVTAVQVELSYDPKILKVVDVVAGNFFENPVVLQKTINETNGRVSYAIGVQPNGQAKKGKGRVAEIIVKPATTKTAQSSVNFLSLTKVTAEGSTKSVLKKTVGATVAVVGE